MKDKRAKQVKQLIKWVEAKLNEWDPIGVAEYVKDEYDTYAPKIAGLLIDGADAYRIREHLTNIETVAMGLQGDATRASTFAEQLVNGYKNRDFAPTDEL